VDFLNRLLASLSNFTKICPLGADVIHADGRTHKQKLKDAFHNGCECAERSINHLMLHREIIAVCSETHTEYANKMCVQNAEYPNIKPGGTKKKQCDLRVKPTTALNFRSRNRTNYDHQKCIFGS